MVFREPGVVEFEDRPLPTPEPGEVLLRTRRTLISPGTELTILSGDFAPGSAWDGYAQFPFVAGYSAAAEVAALGDGVEGVLVGDLVAAGTPHARWATAPAHAVHPLRGADVALDLMPFATLATTVMNGVRRGAGGLGRLGRRLRPGPARPARRPLLPAVRRAAGRSAST